VSVQGVVVAILLAVGTASILLSCVGLLVARDALDRLHFTAPAATIAPACFAVAVLVEEPLSGAAVKAVLVALVLFVTEPVLSHAVARAARVREEGRWCVLDEELARKEPAP
jgi:monovalent cation/proton antiporter MnhG/PhaG subunit